MSAIAQLDDWRRTWFVQALRMPALRWVLSKRYRRIACILTAQASIACALAVFAPMMLLLLAPVVLGVPHLAADVRYLVVRQQTPRLWQKSVWAGVAMMLIMRVGIMAGAWPDMPRLEVGLSCAWWAWALAYAVSTGRWNWRTQLLGCALGGCTVLGLAAPDRSRLIFAHLHNAVALVLWAGLFSSRPRVAWPLVAMIGVTAVVLMTGVAVPMTLAVGGHRLAGVDIRDVAAAMAPGSSLRYAVGVTCAFAFLQSVHYAVWLWGIPQEKIAGQGTLSFRMSWRSAIRDLGSVGLIAVLALMAGLGVAACCNTLVAQQAYLSLAVFHGVMEVAVGTYLWGRRP